MEAKAKHLKQNTIKDLDLEIKKLKKQNKEMLKALKIALNILDWNDLNDERAIDIREAVRNADDTLQFNNSAKIVNTKTPQDYYTEKYINE